MTWVRIDDHFDEHPKLAKVGPLGWALWLAGLAYCNRTLTDGFIPFNIAHSMMGMEAVEEDGKVWTACVTSGMQGDDITCKKIACWLVEAELWEVVKGGYRVHDYLTYQPAKEQVIRERSLSAERQDRFRASRRNAVNNAGGNAVTNDVGNSVINGLVTPAPVPGPVPGPGTRNPDQKDAETPPDQSVRVGGAGGADAPLAPEKPPPKKWQPLTDEWLAQKAEEYADALGGVVIAKDEIDAALGHKNLGKWNDKRRYVVNWLNRAAKDRGGQHGTDRSHAPGHGAYDPNFDPDDIARLGRTSTRAAPAALSPPNGALPAGERAGLEAAP